jgi:hypothetical protein
MPMGPPLHHHHPSGFFAQAAPQTPPMRCSPSNQMQIRPVPQVLEYRDMFPIDYASVVSLFPFLLACAEIHLRAEYLDWPENGSIALFDLKLAARSVLEELGSESCFLVGPRLVRFCLGSDRTSGVFEKACPGLVGLNPARSRGVWETALSRYTYHMPRFKSRTQDL